MTPCDLGSHGHGIVKDMNLIQASWSQVLQGHAFWQSCGKNERQNWAVDSD